MTYGKNRRLRRTGLWSLLLAFGCAGGDAARDGLADESAVAGAEGPEGTPAAATSPGGPGVTTGVVAGTPPGGLAQWIDEIRTAVDTLPALAEQNPAAAKNQALQLYVGRQEYIEIYYGTTGRAVKDAALAEAVMTAETRFHELLRTVNTPDGSVDTSALAAAASALAAQYDRVLERAAALQLDVDQLVLAAGGTR